MTIRPTRIGYAVIVVSVLLANHPAAAQQCHSCLDEYQGCQVMGPTTNVSRHAVGVGCFQEISGHVAHLKEINRVVSSRNRAWPKPFACADRQLYFQMWDPMLETGWKSACVFSRQHFVDDTAELNQAGRMKIAAIMKNYPIGQKAFYLDRERPAELSNKRLATLKNRVEEWYGLEQVNEIALIGRGPLQGDGSRAEVISEMYLNGLQPPVMTVPLGGSAASGVSSDD
ncbi:MAG: hypothetical protein MK108_10580 [Mariniblastus sp.]|nr:hypothetical protein [Mariniblastus sp.]